MLRNVYFSYVVYNTHPKISELLKKNNAIISPGATMFPTWRMVRSPLVLGVVESIPAHAMWALCWTNTVCVGFLGVLPFPPTFFIPPIYPIIIHTV